MSGMNAETGKALAGIDHLKQSIRDILLTPIGSRVMRRSYGSRLLYLLDQPVNEVLIASIQSAVVEALTHYEPRLRLSRVAVNSLEQGVLNLAIEGFYLPDNKVIRLENISIEA
ncbi:MAG: GPW/gp25 family protein [Pseudomonadota bacterium]